MSKKTNDKKDIMPELLEDMSVNDYWSKVERFNIDLNKKRYNLILNILNDICGLTNEFRYKSLIRFNRIFRETLLKNTDRNKKVFLKYTDEIKTLLSIEIILDDIKDDYFIKTIRRMLASINYKFVASEYNNNKIYKVKS